MPTAAQTLPTVAQTGVLLGLDGAPARLGALGRWLCDPDDFFTAGEPASGSTVTASDPATGSTVTAESLAFPRDWPAVFKQSALLKGLVNKQLKGVRVRAIASPPTGTDGATALAAPLRLMDALHSFANASQLEVALPGWRIVKGFIVFEVADAPAGAGFVALRHWWNVAPSGAWIDVTPPLSPAEEGGGAGKRLLVESSLGEKAEAPLTTAQQAVAAAFVRADSAAAETPPAEPSSADAPVASAAAPAPPPPPQFMAGDVVRVDGLAGRPDLNGLSGVVTHYDTERGRYHVEMMGASGRSGGGGAGAADGAEVVALRVANLSLQAEVDEIEEIVTPGAREPEERPAGARDGGGGGGGGAGGGGAGAFGTPFGASFSGGGGGGGDGWRPMGPAQPDMRSMPSFMRERWQEMQEVEGLGDSSDDEGGQEPLADLSRSHKLWTVTLIKMGKLGMRISDTDDATEHGYARVELVSEGPAAAAGIQEGDLILVVNGSAVRGRADATAAIGACSGLLTLQLARKSSALAAGLGGGSSAGGAFCHGVD